MRVWLGACLSGEFQCVTGQSKHDFALLTASRRAGLHQTAQVLGHLFEIMQLAFQRPQMGFGDFVDFISGPAFRGLEIE